MSHVVIYACVLDLLVSLSGCQHCRYTTILHYTHVALCVSCCLESAHDDHMTSLGHDGSVAVESWLALGAGVRRRRTPGGDLTHCYKGTVVRNTTSEGKQGCCGRSCRDVIRTELKFRQQ